MWTPTGWTETATAAPAEPLPNGFALERAMRTGPSALELRNRSRKRHNEGSAPKRVPPVGLILTVLETAGMGRILATTRNLHPADQALHSMHRNMTPVEYLS